MASIDETRIDISPNISRLTHSDVGELGLLKIRGDIQPVDRDNCHQGFARLNSIADMDALARDYPSDRRTHLGIAQIELGGFEYRLCLLYDWPIVARVVDYVAAQRRARLLELMLCKGLVGHGDAQGGSRLVIKLGRNHILLAKRLGAIKVQLGFAKLRAGKVYACFRGLQLRVKL